MADVRSGDDPAASGSAPFSAEDLLPLVYDELRRLARGYLRHERRDHTLETTALVHEVFMRLVRQSRVEWQGRTHFLAVAATAMRRLLINHAEGNSAKKRGGDWQRVTLDPGLAGAEGLALDRLLDLDAALKKLGRLNARQGRVAELRSFAGMSTDEIAAELAVSIATVERDWSFAKAWLRRELSSADSR